MTLTPRHIGRLLLVDDDRGTTQTFAWILTLEGYDVRTASSAEGGLREAGAWHPDAIILDFRMPLINGLGFLYRLRTGSHHRNTPVVIVTGECGLDDATMTEIRELGADVCFKPLSIEELVEVVSKLVAFPPPSPGTHRLLGLRG